MTKRVALYLRVSSPEQAEKFGLSAQEQAGKNWCAEQGYPEPAVKVEPGVSAFSDEITDRPAFAALMADVEAGQYDLIVVDQIDRFARSNLVAVQQLRHLYRHDCALVSLKERWDFSTASGRFQFQLMASLAEFDSRLKSERVRAAIRQKRLAGGYHGQLPFGAMFGPGGALVINPAQADALALLLDLYTERGAVHVAAQLTSRGVPTQRGKEVWQPISVHSIIASGAWLLDQPEPWPTRYRAARDRPPLARTPGARGVNLLSGLLRCGCGGVLVYSTTRKRTGQRYFECRNYSKARPHGLHCPHVKTTVDYYEAIVTDWFLSIPPLKEVPEDASVAEARIRIAELRRRAEEIYMDNGDRSAYRARLAALDAEESALPLPLPLGEVLIAQVARMQAAWARLTTREKNAVLRSVLQKVLITGRAVEVVPTPELAALLAGQTKGGAVTPPVAASL